MAAPALVIAADGAQSPGTRGLDVRLGAVPDALYRHVHRHLQDQHADRRPGDHRHQRARVVSVLGVPRGTGGRWAAFKGA